MKTVFIILLAVFGYNVEGIKIRATRTRTIQFKQNQNPRAQTQHFRLLSQNQNAPIYKNSKQTYSVVHPGGVRYNIFSGSGAYATHMKNNLNTGQTYQSVHHWPTSAIQSISVDQNGYNSGYNGLIGQTGHQSWQNSAGGTPIDISVQQNGINPGYNGLIGHSGYQSWQNSAGGTPIDISEQQNGINPGYNGLIGHSGYQSWQNSAGGTPIDISLQQNGINPGYNGLIGHSGYQSWQNSAGETPIDIAAVQQNEINPGHTGQIKQTVYRQNFVSGAPIDFSVQQNGINPGHTGQIKQTVYQSWQNLGDVERRGDIDLSLHQNLQNSANVRPNQGAYVEHSGLNSENIGQSVYQSWDNAASKRSIDITAMRSGVIQGNVAALQSSQSSAPESPVDFTTDQTILNVQSKDQNFPIAADEGEINLSVDRSLSNAANGGQINYFVQHTIPTYGQINYDVEQSEQHSDNKEQAIHLLNQGEASTDHEPQFINEIKVNINDNTGPINSVSRSDVIHSADESKLNQLHEAVHDMKGNGSPIDTDTKNYVISPHNGGILSLDQTKLNWPNEALPQNIVKSIHITREENSPIAGVNENDLKSPDNDGLISVDKSKLNWSIGDPIGEIMKIGHINKEKNVIPIDAETPKYLLSPNNGNILSVDRNTFNEAPLQDFVKEIGNDKENISPIGAIGKNDIITPNNEGIISVDQSKLNWPIGEEVMKIGHINKEENVSPIDAETPNYLLSTTNGDILSVDQNKFNEAPLQDFVKEIDIIKEENISPIGAIGKNFILTPDNGGIISVHQSKLNWPIGGPLQHIMKNGHVNKEENSSPLAAETLSYQLSPNNEGKITVVQSVLNRADQTPLQDIEKDIYLKDEESVIPVEDLITNDLVSPDNIANIGLLTVTNAEVNSDPISIVTENDDERVSSVDQTELYEASKVPLPKFFEDMKINITENSGPVSRIRKNYLNKNIIVHQSKNELKPIPIYLNKLKPSQQQGPITGYSNILRSDQKESSAPITLKSNRQRSAVLKTLSNQVVTAQQQPLIDPYKIWPGNLQWNKIRNISPQQGYSGFSGICQNPNSNGITKSEGVYYDAQPSEHTQEIFGYIDYLRKLGFRQNPSFALEPQIIGRYTNVENTQPIYYDKEMYPYYKAGTIDINKYNNPQTSYYLPTPSQNKFDVHSEIYETNKNPLQRINIEANEDTEVTTKASYYTNVHSIYKLGNLNIQKYNIPQRNYYATASSPAVKNEFDIQSEKLIPHENQLSQIGIDRNGDKSPDYTNPNLDEKAIHPFNKLVNLNAYNNPKVKYYIPALPQPVRNKLHTQSVNFQPNEYILQQFDIKADKEEGVITNPSDSRIIKIKPHSVQKTFATENFVPESRLASTITKVTEISGYEKPTTEKEYVYQITQALMPELLKLYYSNCDNGYDEKLIEEFKKVVVSIQEEHCKLKK